MSHTHGRPGRQEDGYLGTRTLEVSVNMGPESPKKRQHGVRHGGTCL